MEEPSRVSFRDTRLASRKAKEAANRRSQAATWLESMLGPLGLSTNPSEKEFISCLRSGIVLCNVINKIKPGSVAKVVINQPPSSESEMQPLPAYQYFENIRNFLFAVEELKLPSFEASDIEKENLEAGSSAKIVDCVLALKCYNEFKKNSGGCGTSWKQIKSPILLQFRSNKTQSSSLGRKLDLSKNSVKQHCEQNDDQKENPDKVDDLVQALSNCMFDSKENIDQKFLDSWHQGSVASAKLFSKILSSCLKDQESKLILKKLCMDEEKEETINFQKSCNILKDSCNKQNHLEAKEKELLELKKLLQRIREDFSELQSQMQNDIAQLGTEIVGLSSTASRYQEAIKENTHLYNMLQELRGNIRVFCRIRPNFHSEAKSSIDYIGSDGSLIILDPFKPQNSRRMFQFNKVFGPSSSQEEVYKEIQSLVRSVMDGYNVCIFAYGQTGSGKTHTMSGPADGSEKDMGINYMALNDLFEISRTRSDIKYDIRVQMVEIYNEQVRDLLCKEASTKKLEIRNCSGNGGLSLPDAAMDSVQSTSDVLDLMKMGNHNRAFSSTAMNNRSSRSHSIFTVHVHSKDVSGSMTNSCLHLVDLAGSERVDKSEVTGDRLKEAQHINKSLSCLGDVISALAQKNSHIPYRNSKLTLLLQNSLGGHAKMLMLAHVSPEADSYGETVSTLKFAQRTSSVEIGAAHVNKESSEVLQLKEEVANLKKALASREGDKAMPSSKMERPKYSVDVTPPTLRTRRLSIENSSIRKSSLPLTADGQKLLKSPLSRPKFGCETGPARSRRLSLECSNKKQQDIEMFASVQYYQPKDAPKLNKKHELEAEVRSIEMSDEVSTVTFDALCGSEQQRVEIRYSKKAKPTAESSRILENVLMTPDTDKTSSISKSSKRSHVQKSLQAIGKFINGYEKRTSQNPSETTPSSKRGRNSDKFVIKSPITTEARMQRRQSLASASTSVSRRSSLGGLSTDSYTADIQNLRSKTPPTKSTTNTIKRRK